MKAEFIDRMGTDLTVVNAARVSFDKESDWVWVEKGPDASYHTLSVRDQKLINYLATHNHWTPFSHVSIQMRETVPIFVARQRFKHMVGFSYNEVSRRYVAGDPEFYAPTEWRKSAENKKQGSSDEAVELGWEVTQLYNKFLYSAKLLYNSMLAAGVCPEQARMILPQSMYTSYYVTGTLAAWARAYKLRIDPHAQKEIQDLASQWGDIISSIPELQHSWKALTQ
jgi:thymidylate synthase (FAD)